MQMTAGANHQRIRLYGADHLVGGAEKLCITIFRPHQAAYPRFIRIDYPNYTKINIAGIQGLADQLSDTEPQTTHSNPDHAAPPSCLPKKRWKLFSENASQRLLNLRSGHPGQRKLSAFCAISPMIPRSRFAQ